MNAVKQNQVALRLKSTLKYWVVHADKKKLKCSLSLNFALQTHSHRSDPTSIRKDTSDWLEELHTPVPTPIYSPPFLNFGETLTCFTQGIRSQSHAWQQHVWQRSFWYQCADAHQVCSGGRQKGPRNRRTDKPAQLHLHSCQSHFHCCQKGWDC